MGMYRMASGAAAGALVLLALTSGPAVAAPRTASGPAVAAPRTASGPAVAAPRTAGESAAAVASCTNPEWRVSANYAGYTAGYSWAWNVVVAQGATGDRVREIQCLLNWNPGYTGTPLVVDGIYGSTTAWAVENYQWSTGLPEDGVVGPETWRGLRYGGEI